MENLEGKTGMEKIEQCIKNAENNINVLCMIIHNTTEENRDEAYCRRLLSRAADVRKNLNLLNRTFEGELK